MTKTGRARGQSEGRFKQCYNYNCILRWGDKGGPPGGEWERELRESVRERPPQTRHHEALALAGARRRIEERVEPDGQVGEPVREPAGARASGRARGGWRIRLISDVQSEITMNYVYAYVQRAEEKREAMRQKEREKERERESGKTGERDERFASLDQLNNLKNPVDPFAWCRGSLLALGHGPHAVGGDISMDMTKQLAGRQPGYVYDW
jgi:hypothetical protein